MTDPWQAYNEFMLHGEIERFTKLFARHELFKQVLELPGDIVECGVLKGTGLFLWARLLQIYSPRTKRKVVGFDTFEGYPAETSQDHDRQTGQEFKRQQIQDAAAVSVSHLMHAAENLGLADRIELVPGDATRSIPEYVAANPGFRIALLDLDFVLYDPTKAALEGFYPLVVPEGLIIFDEYAVAGMGESDAVDEFFAGKKLQLRQFPWATSPTAWCVKP